MKKQRMIRTREFLPECARDEEGADKFLRGHFAVFDEEYEIYPGYVEKIAPGAFAESIAKDDIRALINHDTTLVLGRTRAGTLMLSEDTHGGYMQIKINDEDSAARDAYARVFRGDVTQCSFAFDVQEKEETEDEAGRWIMTLKKVKLYEVSICTFPAYPQTDVEARTDGVTPEYIIKSWYEKMSRKYEFLREGWKI